MNPKPSTAPLLELHDARVRRAGRTILAVDELCLAEGEKIAILGPNGSGKSTLVRLLTREIHPLHREKPPILFRGRDRIALTDIKRALGIVSSTMEREIDVHLPALNVVEGGMFGTLGTPVSVTSTPATQQTAREALRQLRIEDLADQDCTTLSSGQIRRVLIARALVSNPDTLIFDEPCTGLDPQGIFYVRQAMRDLARAGKGIVLVTHYPEDIMPEIKRVVLLKEGKVAADGPKESLLTSAVISKLFEAPLAVQTRTDAQGERYYSLVEKYE
ncbi:ATP-binding cassette domain-containing protein [Eggerthellaceae bacterium zg-887]|uniref:ABC transporter ATP-binding protein n=1 Tax=Xiamenia xianingshaonis TaxID=2682776 RepID=UPI001408FED8|nr:ATP-binding cassette domain-containing protein [Xiamenia xianingshaonis]NHM16416.1 ATP-binding cassette domain-containing protein [Xiamenia xianingshaonis]